MILILPVVWCTIIYRRPGWMGLSLQHAAIWVNEVVVAHMRGGEVLSGQVCKPITYIVVASRDKAAFIEIKGIGY